MGRLTLRMGWLCLLGLFFNGCNDTDGAPQASGTAPSSLSAPGVTRSTKHVEAASNRITEHESERDKAARKDRFRRALEPMLSRKADAQSVRTNAKGRKVISLHGGYGHAMMARRGANGKLEYGCFDAVEPAVEFVTGTGSEVIR